jgi:hypothetical protein
VPLKVAAASAVTVAAAGMWVDSSSDKEGELKGEDGGVPLAQFWKA